MKKTTLHRILLSAGVLLIHAAYAATLPLPPRVTVWGLGGSDVLGRGDAMAALLGNDQQILWIDAQGKYGEEGTGFGGAGLGYRFVNLDSRVLGVYGFMDYTRSAKDNSFWVASPGIESMGDVWDFRVNGYFPVREETKSAGQAFGDEIGNNQFVFFTGHQQFDRLFDLTETVGNGVDGEIGRTFATFHHARAYLGGYYFHPKDGRDINSIQGVSGRIEYPIRSHLGIIATDSYDNVTRNTALVGLQVSFGGYSSEPYATEAKERILDPIYRNLATQSNGTGIPVVEGALAESGRVLERDHIYFFNAAGGRTFNATNGAGNCTAEQPCNGTSFSQSTVNAINGFEPNTNFYFTPGTYTFEPAPNGRLELNNGQSMWGRTPDYLLPAQGDARALFLGGLDLFQGNNRLDSIRLLNAATDDTGAGSNLIALSIQNAPNVVLFNDAIEASVTEEGNLLFPNNNFASGIYANNSQVLIKDSTISATASVTGNNNGGSNFATGIGGNDGDFNTNTFTLLNSGVSGSASVAGNNSANFATGIGGNGGDFNTNTFTLLNSSVSGSASVAGDNNANFATGIGGDNGDFNTNTFTLLNSSVSGLASVAGFNDSGNFATGIGGNGGDFNTNTFTLLNSSVSGSASVAGDNSTNFSANFATGIGGNAGDFNTNTFTLLNSSVSGSASVAGNNNNLNFATGIGGNSGGFIGNTITINGGALNATATVNGDNSGINQTIGMNMNGANNTVAIDQSTINVLAEVLGNNTGSNTATGLIATGLGSMINISNSTVNVTGNANGTNTVDGGSGAITATNTQLNCRVNGMAFACSF